MSSSAPGGDDDVCCDIPSIFFLRFHWTYDFFGIVFVWIFTLLPGNLIIFDYYLLFLFLACCVHFWNHEFKTSIIL